MSQKLISAYDVARDFLIGQIPSDEAESVLDSYLDFKDASTEAKPMGVIYERLLSSAQNANMKEKVIGSAIGGVNKLNGVLLSFEPQKVFDTYGVDDVKLLSAIKDKLKPKGKIRELPNSIWPKYCRTILSAAIFLKQFSSGEDFYEWANHFYNDNKSISALPLILSEEIYGVGYALACDFLKELGFIKYGKPDVHIKDIFFGLGLCDANTSDYRIQKIIIEMAEAKGNDVSPYNVDKLFWLIGSGKFYNHKEIGKDGEIGSKKKAFLLQFSSHI